MTIYNHNRPRVGDRVWVEGREPQPNGKIISINYHGPDPEIRVRFHDKGGQGFYPQERFLGNREQNTWMIWAEQYEDAYEDAEDRLDVMILFDMCMADEKQLWGEKLPRLLFLIKYFDFKRLRYKHGCERRRARVAQLVGEYGPRVDWAEHERLILSYYTGRAISARIRGKQES